MESDVDNYILRPIQDDDITKNLSLGLASFEPLKTFLRKSALDFHRYDIAKTYVLVEPDKTPARVWGYITLMNSEIDLAQSSRPNESPALGRYESFPAVKIARLAVDKSLQRNGWGRMMLDWSINLVRLAIMPHVGCRFIVVDSKKESIFFYQQSGFMLLNKETAESEEHPPMYFDLHSNKLTS